LLDPCRHDASDRTVVVERDLLLFYDEPRARVLVREATNQRLDGIDQPRLLAPWQRS